MKYPALINTLIIATTVILVMMACEQEKKQVFDLASHCPPGFELGDDNRCWSRTLYQQYESLRNSGVGGLKTALPEVREGFSPQQIDLGRYLF